MVAIPAETVSLKIGSQHFGNGIMICGRLREPFEDVVDEFDSFCKIARNHPEILLRLRLLTEFIADPDTKKTMGRSCLSSRTNFIPVQFSDI